jgi:MSHA biogenesis protein MshN
MSVINKMLQDLDRRQALGGVPEARVVRPSTAKPVGREWFWRVLVVLLAAALVWMGWVAIQLLPRKPLATDLAFTAAAQAHSRAAIRAVAPPIKEPKPAPAVEPPAAEAAPAEPARPAAEPASDALRLAFELQTPIRERVEPEPAKPQPTRTTPKAAAPPPAPKAIDKREIVRSAADSAEAHYRRAARYLNQGRVAEAEEQLAAALHADPVHAGARQAYVALLLEQQRIDPARRLLEEALAINPAQPTFALALARIHAEQRDYAAALEVMDRARPAARGADFHALRGALLQRLTRHGEAVEAYENAIRGGTALPTTWIGFGISLEALGRRPEAAQAYRRALAAGPIAPEAREYAESRAKALE